MLTNRLLCLVSMLCGAILLAQPVRAQPPEIGAVDLKKMMDTSKVMVVFPLSPIEFENLHIPGSVNLPLEELEPQLPGDKNRAMVFYCLGRT